MQPMEDVSSIASLGNTKLLNAKKEIVNAGEIWKDHVAVVYLAAESLKVLPTRLGDDSLKVNIVGIGSEVLGFDTFIEEGFMKFAAVYVDEEQLLHRTLSTRFAGGEMLKAIFSPSTYINIWNSPVKGNLVGGTKPYYYDAILVIGRDQKILHQQQLTDTSNTKVDVDAIVEATKKALLPPL